MNSGGLSRRDTIAAIAMQSIAKAYPLDTGGFDATKMIVVNAVHLADALIAELDKKGESLLVPCSHEWKHEHGYRNCDLCGMTLKLCAHANWIDMEAGIGQCRLCMAMLPYSAFNSKPDTGPFGCAPVEA